MRAIAPRAIWVTAIASIAVLTMLPGLWIGPSIDASVFSTVSWRIAEGDALYAEIWDHKPPGVYLPYIAAEFLTANAALSWIVVWLISVGAVCVMALAVRDVLRRAGVDVAVASIAAGLAALGASAYLLSLGGGLGETFALAPMSGALMAASRQRWVLAGALVGFSVVISLQAAPVGIAIGMLVVAGPDRTVTHRLLLALLGVLGVLLATLAALAVNGGLAAATDALIAYSAAYRAVSTEGASRSVWSLVPWAILVLLPLILGVGVAAVGRRRLAGGHLAAACAAWLVIGVAVIALQGRFYAHYAAPLVVPMAVLAGLGLAAWLSLAVASRVPHRLAGMLERFPFLLDHYVAYSRKP